MKWFLLFSLITIARAQTSKPTTAQPTTAQVVGNTCSACTTPACVYYRHAYGPNVEEVTIGCASPTLSPSCVAQSGNFGVGASGLYSFGGGSTQVNIASISPTGVGASGKINIGANAASATTQEINIGASTNGVITIGGSTSTMNAPGTVTLGAGGAGSPVTLGAVGSNVFVGYTATPSPVATNNVLIGGTSTYVRIGENFGSAASIGIGSGGAGVISLGSSATPVTIAPAVTSPAYVSIGSGASTGDLYLGANSPTPSVQNILLGATTAGTIAIGGIASTVNIAVGQSAGPVTIGANSPTPSAQTINIAPTTTGTITVGGSGSAVTIASATTAAVNIANGAATGTVTVGSSTSSAQTINIAPTTSGTITIGGSLTVPSPRQTVRIGGTQTPSATESTDVIVNTYHYLNNIGLFYMQSGDASAAYPTSFDQHTLIGLPKSPTPSPNSFKFSAPSATNVVVQSCPTGVPTTNAGFTYTNNNDCLVLQQPGVYKICMGGINTPTSPAPLLYLRRVSCRGSAGVAMACAPNPSPVCPSASLNTPSPSIPTTFTPTTIGNSNCDVANLRQIPSTGTNLLYQCMTVVAPSVTTDAGAAPVAYGISFYSGVPTGSSVLQSAGGEIYAEQVGPA